MSKAALSLFVFSIYLFVVGLVLATIPNVLLSLFRVPETNEVWIRIVGLLAGVLGFYYLTAARNELTSFFRATVIGRMAALVIFSSFVVLGIAPPALVLFGIVDGAAAVWTGLALRK